MIIYESVTRASHLHVPAYIVETIYIIYATCTQWWCGILIWWFLAKSLFILSFRAFLNYYFTLLLYINHHKLYLHIHMYREDIYLFNMHMQYILIIHLWYWCKIIILISKSHIYICTFLHILMYAHLSAIQTRTY